MVGFECTAMPVDRIGYIEERYLERISDHLFIDHRDGALYCQEADSVVRIDVARHDD